MCDRLIIEGDSWSWHCKSRHVALNKSEVTFEYLVEVGLQDALQKVPNLNGTFVHQENTVDHLSQPSTISQTINFTDVSVDKS